MGSHAWAVRIPQILPMTTYRPSATSAPTSMTIAESFDYPHLVPVEIWIACWAFCSSRQLRRLSVVCRLFRSLSLPLLFEHQTLDLAALETGLAQNNWVDRFHHAHRMAVRLDRLAPSPFPALVRSWRVTFGGRRRPRRLERDIRHMELFRAMQDRVVATFWATLGRYHNLSSLHIEASKIDRATWETVRSLPMLKSLDLQVHDIDMADRHSDTGPQHSEDASPSMLHTLHLPHASHLLAGFATSELSSLVHLSIRSVHEAEPFLRFVQQCPRLESLAIESLPRTFASIHVNPHSLPRLRTLVGPPCVLGLLVPGRPITSVRIADQTPMLALDELLSACTDITRHCHSIRALALPRTSPTLGFLHDIISLFPHIKELHELDVEVDEDEGVPMVSDAHAFERLPADELSDDETETEDAPQRIVDAMIISDAFDGHGRMGLFTPHGKTILKWLCSDSLLLPSSIESFHLEPTFPEKVGLVKQHQALVSLSLRYPCLRELHLGSTSTSAWRRSGELWESEDKSLVRIAGIAGQAGASLSGEPESEEN
ncbi:hypothetical protein C8R45DRAFT_1097204 [Mycena sanguinolenta]|nr:hypothetical protein C8R45DRAFT_1097204 [Mycena sanguinolenta]